MLESYLWEYDAVTFPGATLGFSWAGQLTIMANTPELRELYTVVDEHVALGFKVRHHEPTSACRPSTSTVRFAQRLCRSPANLPPIPQAHGDGQSGWEERVFLARVIELRPQLRVLFHMGAQLDHKAQWLTWVPFDHFWEGGKIWRCARYPLARDGRPPYYVANVSTWRGEIERIQSQPRQFYKSKVSLRLSTR